MAKPTPTMMGNAANAKVMATLPACATRNVRRALRNFVQADIMTDPRKRLNSRTFICAGVKEMVYRCAENPRLAVIVERAIRPFRSLGQWLGWLTPYAPDAA